MRRVIYTLILIFVSINVAWSSTEQDDIELIKSRYCTYYASIAPDDATIKSYLDSLDLQTGGWCDIDYASTIGTGWRTKEHTRRTMQMAQYYAIGERAEAPLVGREDLLLAIHSAWAYWFRERPYCPTNWYPNVLSCPHELGISFMLMQDEMSDDEMRNAVEIVYKKSRLEKTGSNLIYVANTALMQGLFEKDPALIHRAIDAISSTIFVAKDGEEGIQTDYSYHLHGSQLQTGNYGREAIMMLAPFCEILNGTSFDFSCAQKDILLDLITEGFRWSLWSGSMDINGSGRQYGPDMLQQKGVNILESAVRISVAATSDQKRKVEAMVRENEGRCRKSLLGQKFFDKSDYVVHRRKGWAASLKMHSTRVQATEMSGNDNRRGFFAADGSLFTYVDGDDYENAPVLWDWCKVPGVTCYETSDSLIVSPFKTRNYGDWDILNKSDFVGAVTDGESGMATMILNKEKQHYRKSWIMTPEFVLCLGCDLREESGDSVLTTSVEQRLLDGELAVLQQGKWQNIDGYFVAHESGLRLHHHKTGYIILGDNECEASVESRRVNWNEITLSIDSMVYEDRVASIFVRHKSQPGEYSYLILPDMSRRQVAKFDTEKLDIIENNKDIQLVSHDGIYYLTAFALCSYKINDELSIDVAKEGVFMFERKGDSWSVIAHDPTKTLDDEEMKSKIKIEFK